MAGAGGSALRELLGRCGVGGVGGCGVLDAPGAPCSTAEMKGGMDVPSLPSAPLPSGLRHAHPMLTPAQSPVFTHPLPGLVLFLCP